MSAPPGKKIDSHCSGLSSCDSGLSMGRIGAKASAFGFYFRLDRTSNGTSCSNTGLWRFYVRSTWEKNGLALLWAHPSIVSAFTLPSLFSTPIFPAYPFDSVRSSPAEVAHSFQIHTRETAAQSGLGQPPLLPLNTAVLSISAADLGPVLGSPASGALHSVNRHSRLLPWESPRRSLLAFVLGSSFGSQVDRGQRPADARAQFAAAVSSISIPAMSSRIRTLALTPGMYSTAAPDVVRVFSMLLGAPVVATSWGGHSASCALAVGPGLRRAPLVYEAGKEDGYCNRLMVSIQDPGSSDADENIDQMPSVSPLHLFIIQGDAAQPNYSPSLDLLRNSSASVSSSAQPPPPSLLSSKTTTLVFIYTRLQLAWHKAVYHNPRLDHLSAGSIFMQHTTSNDRFPACRDAILKAMGDSIPLADPFIRFKKKENRAATVCHLHAIRSGLEHLGDRQLYNIIDWALQATCPDREDLFYVITRTLTCNKVLGKYMFLLNMHSLARGKEGGDTFETILGALLRDHSYVFVVERAIRAFQPFIAICLEVLCGTVKRQMEDNVDDTPIPLIPSETLSNTRINKRAREDLRLPADSHMKSSTPLASSKLDFTVGEAVMHLDTVLCYLRNRSPPVTAPPLKTSLDVCSGNGATVQAVLRNTTNVPSLPRNGDSNKTAGSTGSSGRSGKENR
ncbi:hypothetical protein C8R44DRAFT_739313 [Mycena epipterygia]|nr:hypothetical protein C8R44DRAFT_739313 [Mycena epipterygia]